MSACLGSQLWSLDLRSHSLNLTMVGGEQTVAQSSGTGEKQMALELKRHPKEYLVHYLE